MKHERIIALIVALIIAAGVGGVASNDSLRAVFLADIAATARLADGEKVSRLVFNLPIDDLYQQFNLAAPKNISCKTRQSHCLSVMFILSEDGSPLGSTDIPTAISIVTTSLDLAQKDHGLVPLAMPSSGLNHPDKKYYLGVVDPKKPVGANNLARFLCSPTFHHCIVEVSEPQFFRGINYRLSFSFDEGRIDEWRTITQLLIRCINARCELI